jgi:hypothetical protein
MQLDRTGIGKTIIWLNQAGVEKPSELISWAKSFLPGGRKSGGGKSRSPKFSNRNGSVLD